MPDTPLIQTAIKVRRFYEEYSFPAYEEFETPFDLVEKARNGVYASLLDEQLPLGVKVLDAGCGTGQLAIFLSMTNRFVVGVDFSFNSLRKGSAFKHKFGLPHVQFAQMDLFSLGLPDEAFDWVFCNGVLHHTSDAYRGFQSLCRVLKRGGYIAIGLYNPYGRMMLNLRKALFNLTRNRLRWLDFYMRQRSLGREKKQVWYMDQYKNPHEDTFAADDVLRWFAQNGIEYVNSIPKITLSPNTLTRDKLFEKHDAGTKFEHLLCQLAWIFTKGREGGYFVTIGRKRP